VSGEPKRHTPMMVSRRARIRHAPTGCWKRSVDRFMWAQQPGSAQTLKLFTNILAPPCWSQIGIVVMGAKSAFARA